TIGKMKLWQQCLGCLSRFESTIAEKRESKLRTVARWSSSNVWRVYLGLRENLPKERVQTKNSGKVEQQQCLTCLSLFERTLAEKMEGVETNSTVTRWRSSNVWRVCLCLREHLLKRWRELKLTVQ
ncbi:hypothetical protein J6590_076833, partial [Homalodisca vitripennis]